MEVLFLLVLIIQKTSGSDLQIKGVAQKEETTFARRYCKKYDLIQLMSIKTFGHDDLLKQMCLLNLLKLNSLSKFDVRLPLSVCKQICRKTIFIYNINKTNVKRVYCLCIEYFAKSFKFTYENTCLKLWSSLRLKQNSSSVKREVRSLSDTFRKKLRFSSKTIKHQSNETKPCILPEDPNGNFNISESKVGIGVAVYFQCNEGYFLKPFFLQNRYISNTVIVCLKPGNLSLNASCIQKNFSATAELSSKTCALPPVPNGKYASSAKVIAAGSSVAFECNPGYRLRNEKRSKVLIFCRTNGTTSVFPVCDRRLCRLPIILNGKFNQNEQFVLFAGNHAEFTCYAGYYLKEKNATETTIFCSLMGELSVQPICEQRNCTLPKISHGKFIPASKFVSAKQEIIFTCDDNFYMAGSNNSHSTVVKCLPSGVLSTTPNCMKQVCNFPFVANGKYDTDKGFIDVGSKVMFFCNKGFLESKTLASRLFLTCLRNGFLSSLPICEISCELPKIQHGIYLGNSPSSVVANTRVPFICDQGYVAKVSSSFYQVTCGKDGQIQNVPTCVKADGIYAAAQPQLLLSQHNFWWIGIILGVFLIALRFAAPIKRQIRKKTVPQVTSSNSAVVSIVPSDAVPYTSMARSRKPKKTVQGSLEDSYAPTDDYYSQFQLYQPHTVLPHF